MRYCKEKFKVIFISTGTASEKEIIDLRDFFDGWDGELIVMHCVSAYPCEAQNINLPRINHLRNYFKNVGFSDHTQGIFSTITSIDLNPVAIEKHFTVDHELPGRDNKFAILPIEMKDISEYIRIRSNAMKDHGMEFQEIELPSRDNYRGRFNA